jgi:ABC-type oligopeptide transport system substrate-binding subunit
VTAGSFRQAFIRGAHSRMNSPAMQYLSEVVGATAFNAGRASSLPGVVARGNTLTVRLIRPAPDMLARMSMPFFCPLRGSDGINPDGIRNPPGSGPYYFSSYTPDRRIVMQRNRFYRGRRPRNPDRVVINLSAASLEACRLQTIQAQVDWCIDGIPPNSYAQVARTYGINRDNSGRRQPSYYEKPLLGVSYMSMNMTRPIFRGNTNLRKAVNFAINRPALIAQGGFHSGVPTDQILPPAMPGFRNVNAYPLRMNQAALTRARQLAQGRTRDGKVVLYNGNTGARPLRSAVVKENLRQIGLDVEVRLMSRATQKERTGRRNEPFDMTDEGWISDYIDPFSFIGALLQGETIQETENVNVAYFNVPKYNRAIKAAGALGGKRRFDAFGKLDVQISTANDAVPWASYQNFTDRYLVSRRVGCFIYNPNGFFLIGAVCVKR